MQEKIPVERVIATIEKADLVDCADAIEFINQLDFYQYSQAELKAISDKLSERITQLIRLEVRGI
ncbi:hypothetical protein EFA69_19515 [Rufibacter immobilis]|uniref:Uncharacterized protein n=1 Tax=Rufibacter immobilis TaxID=1348778 RepID=A0A3M9MRU4_9BACT|nr:hypothetical protein [Rufibacter immobilis]RNI28254.1 hypothetical protein EFA69_19515 [Rufibacter immobilis]